MKIKRQIIALPLAAVMFLAISAGARENGADGHRQGNPSANRGNSQDQLQASCTPASAKTDLDINNVRTTIMTGGDMWWDLTTARYEVPKGGDAHSIFSGALWIGGLDAGGQLKVAAMTYRQTGNDFWPGPLDTTTVSIDLATCNAFDRHWKVSRKEVEDYALYFENPSNYPGYSTPLVIQSWPGNGNSSLGQGRYLAPFFDADGDGIYNYQAGDYPGFNLNGDAGCNKFQLFGDQVLWWVFNDKGNVHSETGAAAIGLEIHAQAFAFSTNDEINNMTFYTYKIINRSTVSMNNTYFGQWTDADLGYAFDDYVGCDVTRGLGYTYNGDANDGSSSLPAVGTYGANPPAIGMDFFEGPMADTSDGIDNDHDGFTDESGELIIMSKFVYYNNDFSITGNPENATHFYNYLSGFWKDGTPFTYGGNAYGGTQPADYMFPGDSDPLGYGTDGAIVNGNWSEATENFTPADRRMMQSAGPFTLRPGAVNYITVGAVWARAANGGPNASVELMRTTDDKAQRLFNNCFRTLDGPDAPDLTIQELDKEVIIYLSNKPNSNNYLESYHANDPGIVYANVIDTVPPSSVDTTFDFEGYQIFQLKDISVSTADLYNLDKARLVANCDLRNGVTTLVNREFNQALNADIPQDMTIKADDEGIFHSVRLTEDAFATGDRRLINHKTYYYLALSYAYNNYLTYADVSFSSSNPTGASNIGQKKPYLAGRKNVKIYTAIPHIVNPEANGTTQVSSYGSGPKIKRLEGSGNSNNVLDLTDASENAIVNATPVTYNINDLSINAWSGSAHVDVIEYTNGHGPINVKVIDPLNVPEGEFTVRFTDTVNAPVVSSLATWVLTQTSPVSRSWNSDTTTTMITMFANEQIIPELGLSITIAQAPFPGMLANPDHNGYLESSIVYADPTKAWLSGVKDDDSQSETNWIRAGNSAANSNASGCDLAFDDRKAGAEFIDPNADYEGILGGTWAPYTLTSKNINPLISTAPCYYTGPAFWDAATANFNKIENVSNVDVVFTNDRSKWSRVPVFEMGSNIALNYQNDTTFTLRASRSVDKSGRQAGDPGYNSAEGDFIYPYGMSWFPGYAINIETGERLNMAFGENSALTNENGRDMLWNPTANERSNFYDPLFGGQHYIYVFGHNGNERYPTPYSLGPNYNNRLRDVPAYDYGAMIINIMTSGPQTNQSQPYNSSSQGTQGQRTEIWRDAMWCSIPLLSEGFHDWHFDYTGNPLPSDAKVRLRVAKPYRRAISGVVPVLPAKPWIPSDTVFAPQNGNHPFYSFNTYDLKTETNSNSAAVNALDLINVVPNPYYAYSAYEKNQIENRVKITNLPEKCTIKIFTVSGILVRKMTKDSPITSLDWDMKNQAGIPIASGLYIIHVDVPGVGEKILKFFGVLRPIDLDTY